MFKTYITELGFFMTTVGAGALAVSELLPEGKVKMYTLVGGTFLSVVGGGLLGYRVSKKLSAK